MHDDRYPHDGGREGRRGHGHRGHGGHGHGYGRPAGRWPVSEASAGLHQAIHATAAAAHQVALGGDPEGTAKATALLNEARTKLYRLLAGDVQEPPTTTTEA